MKKALIVANLAGFASFLLSDIDILKSMGYEVTYAANANKLPWADTADQLSKRSVSFVNIDFESKMPFSKDNWKAYKQIEKLIRQNTYDVIHCHTPITGVIVRIAAWTSRKKGTVVIYTTHGFSFTLQSSWKSRCVYQLGEYLCAGLCDAIITINQEDYSAARKMPCKKVYYIPGVGVNLSRYNLDGFDRNAYRKRLDIANDEIMVLSVGELSERKNHRIIIEAISLSPFSGNYVYVICGNGVNGGTGTQLIKLAKEKNVRLQLLGFRTDIPELIHSSDIGAIPSVREGLGLAGVESLAAGVPVVGTAVQGIKDYICDGETGYLCDAYDANAYAEAMTKLVSMSAEERKHMKQNCIEKASNFSMERSVAERKKIYQDLLGGQMQNE